MSQCLKKNYLISIFLIVLIANLQGCGKGDDSQEHLQKGVEYLKKGEYKKAELELKTSSQTDKNTAETYYYLALLDEKNRNFKVMKENLVKAIELEPNHLEARVKLGNLLLLLGEDDEANEQVEFLVQKFGENIDVRTLNASLLFKQDKLDEALTIINGVLKTNPNNSGALSIKSAIYAKQGNSSEAIALVDEAILSDPKNITLHLLRLQFHAKEKDQASIVNDYQSLINEFPKNKDLKILFVKELVRMGKEGEAEKILRGLVASNSNDIQAKIMLLDFILSKRGFGDVVIDQFRQFVDQSSDQPAVLLALSQWMVSKRNFDQSNLVLEKIIAKEKDTKFAYAAKTQLANNALAVGARDKAAQLVEGILGENPNYDDAKIIKAKLLLYGKQFDDAIDLLNKISWSQPKSDVIQLLLGQAFLSKGEADKADEFFAKALEFNPNNLDAFNYVYNKLLKNNDTKYAKDLLEKTIKTAPGNLILLERLVKMNLVEKNWQEAEKVVQRISAVNSPVAKDLALFAQAEILRGKQDYQKAIVLYKELLSKLPMNESALLGLAASFEQVHKRSENISYLNNVLKKDSNNVPATTLLANLYLAENKTDQAIALLDKLIVSHPKNIQPYILLAKAKMIQKDTKNAEEVLQKGIKENPNDINLPLALASFHEGQEEWSYAVVIYEDILKRNPNLIVAANNLASILTDRYDDVDKHNKAVDLSEKFKDDPHPNLRDTYGWALVKAGQIKDGLEVLKKVSIDAPDEPIFKYHLAYAYFKNGEAGSAISELKQTIEMANRKKLSDVKNKAESLLKEISK